MDGQGFVHEKKSDEAIVRSQTAVRTAFLRETVLDISQPSELSATSVVPGCLSLASFSVPHELVLSAWTEHTPFALWLVHALRPRSFVELGTHHGLSYFAICQAVETDGGTTRCYAVDTWEGDEHAGHYGEDVWERVSSVNAVRYSAFSTLLRTTFDDALSLFADGSVDLLHIDGRHFYDDVKHDLTSWLPKLSNRGVILLHDINVHERDFGVARLWQEIEGNYPTFTFLHGHGLGVAVVGPDVPPGIAPLIDIAGDSRSAAATRFAYARLGAAIADRFALRTERASVKALYGQLQELQRQETARRAEAEQRAAAELAAAKDKLRQTEDELAALLTMSATVVPKQRVADLEEVLSVVSSDLATARHEISHLTAELQQATALRDSMLTSTSWRISWPVRAAKRVLRNPTIILRKAGVGRWISPAPRSMITMPAAPAAKTAAHAGAPAPSATDAIKALRGRLQQLQPPRVFRVPGQLRRVTMVTDSISEGSLFGGVGTAIVLAAALARHTDATLRVVTRVEPPDSANFATVMATHRRPLPSDVEFAHAPIDGSNELEISDTETFLTTSWWSTCSVRKVIDPARIVYLLQEDERMFYPNGDDRLNCQETLADGKIRFIVNSQLLFDHLTEGPEALANVRAAGVWFEPAFPALAPGETRPPRGSLKRRFFFYARPNNLRNLYWHGLEAIVESIEDGILDPSQWEFHFAGRDLGQLELPGGVRPVLHQNLPWPEYAALTRTIDVGLSLMATPHPSYPPLDLAAAGAIVVTNRYGRKTSLEQYSQSIICVDPTVAALKQGIVEAVSRSADPDRIYHQDHILRDWDVAFKPVLERMFAPSGQA